MHKMCQFIMISWVCLLTGCQLVPVYKPDIQQGNIITQAQVDQLKPGMAPEQVLYIMGPPVLQQNFIQNRWDYIYTMKKPGKKMIEKRLTIYFQHGRLAQMVGTELPRAAVTRAG